MNMFDKKTRVAFHVAPRYFQSRSVVGDNSMHRDTCVSILAEMGIAPAESISLMHTYPDGFTIHCRPDQFAVFIIRRHEIGCCINGIRDLCPKYYQATDMYDDIAKASSVPREAVKRVLHAFRMSTNTTAPTSTVDISDVRVVPDCVVS